MAEDQEVPVRYAADCALSEPLYDTDRYYIQLGRAIALAESGIPVYQLVNKTFGNVEGESYALTEAIYTMANRTLVLKEYEGNLEDGFPPVETPPLGGGTVH